MNDEKKEIIIFIIAMIMFVVGVVYLITHPVTYTELPLEKRIQYEQMIFPNVR